MTEVCPNCGAAIKSGMLSPNARLREDHLHLINLAHDASLNDGCQKCAQSLLERAPRKISDQLWAKRKSAESLLACIPLASIHSPQGWTYRTLGLVTAQSVSGTGLFSDVTSAFTDLFGAQSGAYNQKLRGAEEACRASLRAQAFQIGGNAIVGIDVDYAEVGGTRAMLMVCMTGTVVNVADSSILGADFADNFERLNTETAAVRDLATIARKHHIE